MVIRKYIDSDQPGILELLKLNTPQYFDPSEEKDLIYYLNNHSNNFFIVEDDYKILGCGGFNLQEEPNIVRISWDIIHPQYQRNGIGTLLTQFRIQQIKEIKGIKIICVRTSQMVFKFYELFGFELKEIVKNYWAEGFDLYRMELEIIS